MQYSTFDNSFFAPSAVVSKRSSSIFWGSLVTALLLTVGALHILLPRSNASLASSDTQILWKSEDSTDQSHWKLIWAEEFEGRTLNRSRWNLETINGQQSGNNELEIYTQREANSPVSDGKLRITARKERVGPWRYTSARLTTQYSFAFTYGRVVARFKNPKGKGLWPAFWMLGSSIPTIPWPGCGEVDIMEMVGGPSWPGGGDDRAVGTAHWLGSVRTQVKKHKWTLTRSAVYDGGSITTSSLVHSPNNDSPPHFLPPPPPFLRSRRSRSLSPPTPPPSPPAVPLHSDFHNIALEWNQTHFVWFLDDVMFKQKRIDDTADPGLAAFHQPFFLLLNLAVGGNWPGSPDKEALSNFPHEFEIDYIRVYQTRQPVAETPRFEQPELPGRRSFKHHSKDLDSHFRDRRT